MDDIWDRLWGRIDVVDGECWLWTGVVNDAGYGNIRLNGKTMKCHRLAWMIWHGQEIPPGQLVCHKCDNPRCCNPSHLWLGSHRQNMADMAMKGRTRVRRGASNTMVRHSDEQAVAAVKDYLTTGMSLSQVSRRHGISDKTLFHWVSGRNRPGVIKRALREVA